VAVQEAEGKESWTGMLARSKQGHDKGALFLIIKEEAAYVYLADGRGRSLEKPKKKKKKHIQIIKKKPLGNLEEPGEGCCLRNEDIKRVIKQEDVACQRQM
jgi:hypothetical protein